MFHVGANLDIGARVARITRGTMFELEAQSDRMFPIWYIWTLESTCFGAFASEDMSENFIITEK